MMELNELRIGNWVDNGEGFHFVIDASSMIDIINESQTEGNSSLKPIPLTEDWFKRFGFEDGFHGRWFSPKQNPCITFDKVITLEDLEVNTKIQVVMWKLLFNDSREVVIKYVHQLQNLCFALIGEEL